MATRREVLGTLAATGTELDVWANALVALNHAVRDREIAVTTWQDRVADLNRSIPVDELVRYLDIDFEASARKFAGAG